MARWLELLKGVFNINGLKPESWAFYCHYVSAIFTFTMAVILTGRITKEHPLDCRIFGQFSKTFSDDCWHSDGTSVLVRMDLDMPTKITYYNWQIQLMPYILAVAFYVTRFLWKVLRTDDVPITDTIKKLRAISDTESRQREINNLADCFQQNLKTHNRDMLLFGTLQFFNVLHVILQIFILFWFFGTNGFELTDGTWDVSFFFISFTVTTLLDIKLTEFEFVSRFFRRVLFVRLLEVCRGQHRRPTRPIVTFHSICILNIHILF